MKIQDKVVVVTGGANGIGRALCRRFAAEGARGVGVADGDPEGAEKVVKEIGWFAAPTDVVVKLTSFGSWLRQSMPSDRLISSAPMRGSVAWPAERKREHLCEKRA